MWTSLDWLIARPFAHRGLHDAALGIIENTAGAVRAAIAGDYGIEIDLQISADGEAMVHHDDVLGRLTEGDGRLDSLTAAELKRVAFRGSDERMMTLGELCDNGRFATCLASMTAPNCVLVVSTSGASDVTSTVSFVAPICSTELSVST